MFCLVFKSDKNMKYSLIFEETNRMLLFKFCKETIWDTNILSKIDGRCLCVFGTIIYICRDTKAKITNHFFTPWNFKVCFTKMPLKLTENMLFSRRNIHSIINLHFKKLHQISKRVNGIQTMQKIICKCSYLKYC